MKIDEMVPTKSSFLTKDDVGEAGKNLTIAKFETQEVGVENDKEMKYVIVWQQADFKPMVLNKQNASRLKIIFKSDDTDAMIGGTVNVFCDPFVEFGGKIVGGLRIRPTTAQAQAKAPTQARKPAQDTGPESPPLEAYEGEDSTIPF